MRAISSRLILASVFLVLAMDRFSAAEPAATGLWEQVDERSGKAESWFRIAERNGVYDGTIVKIFFKPGEDQNRFATSARAPIAASRSWA